jgi:hypothetical protein
MALGGQMQQCLSVLDKLTRHAISKLFAQPVDPDHDNLPNYTTVVTRPMDLGTVRKKLLSGEYPTVAAWREDMDLIWLNSLAFHPRGSLISTVTLELQSLFRKYSAHLTESPDADWLSKLCALRDEVNTVPRPASMGPPRREGSKPPLQRSQPEPKGVTEKPKHPKKHQTSFTKTEIAKLAADINSLKDDLHVLSIFGILARYEPGLNTDVDRLELDIAPLRIPTLNALRAKVDKCLGIA